MEFKFTDPVTDFSDGLNVVKTYHRDLLIRGQALLTLVEEISEFDMNETLANRCIDMHCYFFHANRLHHLDEELGLFPCLISSQSQLFNGMVERLMIDHKEIEADWSALEQFLANPEQINDSQQLRELATAFEKSQREHLTREEEDFLPKVEQLLSLEQRRETGLTMAKVRKLQG